MLNIDRIDKLDNGYELIIKANDHNEFNDLERIIDCYNAGQVSIADESSADGEEDVVNNPSHYKGKGGLEVYDIMRSFMADDEVKGWHKACALKYILRAGKKDPSKLNEDLNKAIWHLNEWVKMNG